jgi:hypothetical protein
MTDCPRPTCYALRSVDEHGYCNACGKMVPTAVLGKPGVYVAASSTSIFAPKK